MTEQSWRFAARYSGTPPTRSPDLFRLVGDLAIHL